MFRVLVRAFLILCQLFCLPLVNTDEETKQVCYGELGCFSLEAPWNFYRRPKPQSPDKLNIRFCLITRNTQQGDKLKDDYAVEVSSAYVPTADSLRDLDFQENRQHTIFDIHGLCEVRKELEEAQKFSREAYLQRDVNLIYVDWDSRVADRGYPQNVSNTRIVAAAAAKFIQSLIDSFQLRLSKIHIVGFSLGAHIAGYIGKRIPNIYRITALDAAQPGFEGADPTIRISRTDAQHVDALHTCAKSFQWHIGLGYRYPIGDIDFYFNGGKNQPGCREWKKHYSELGWSVQRISSYIVKVASQCSHQRALAYWAEALQSECVMKGVVKKKKTRKERCDSKHAECQLAMQPIANDGKLTAADKIHAIVGWDTFETGWVEGVFQVKTNSRSPFCIELIE